jgi:hypothetical protein
MGSYADFEAASAAFDAKNTNYAVNGGMHALLGAPPGSSAPGPKPGDMMSFAMSGQMGVDARRAAMAPGSSYFLSVGNAMAAGKMRMGASNALQARNWQQNSAGFDMGSGLVEGIKAGLNIGDTLNQVANGMEVSRGGTLGVGGSSAPVTTAQSAEIDRLITSLPPEGSSPEEQ